MSGKYNMLFTPVQIGGTSIKNRFILCAISGTNIIEAQVGYKFNKDCREFYIERAKSGVGLMIPGMVAIKSFAGNKWLYQNEKLFMGPVKQLMDELHRYDAKLFLQIGAGMGRSMTPIPMLKNLYRSNFKRSMAKLLGGFDVQRMFTGPSAGMPNVWDPEIKTSELAKEEIEKIIDAYGKAASLCKRAGIDGIEIHALHEGYLLDQFAMSATNKRTDEYGGSLENRLRFTTEIIKSIKSACGAGYPVSIRFSVESKMIAFGVGAVPGEKYIEFGRNRQESVQVAQLLEAAGVDLLNADNGTYDSWFWAHPPVYMPLGCNLDDVAFVKKYVSIPVACAGRMEDPDMAASAISNNRIDAVGIARQFLCDGEYVSKIEREDIEDIRPCIACHNGCFGVYRYKGLAADLPETPFGRCALNPVTFQEGKYRLTPAIQKKKVGVIGGGIGGMEAARLCALRGHCVTLYEKSNELGGVFIAAAAPSFKEKDKALIEWYKRQIFKLPVDVRLNTEISNLQTLEADEIIIATGAKPRRLSIPGIDNSNVMEAIEYLRGQRQVGENVVIIGGGLTGCEIAYDLALKGKKPVIVEMQDDILKVKNLSAANSNMLRELIRYHQIPVEINAKVSAIEKEGVIIQNEKGKKLIPARSVIVSVGYIPDTPLTGSAGSNVHIIGDAAKVGNLLHVIRGAYDAAIGI